MKTCKTCQQSQPLSEFSPHPSTRDRHNNDCKGCVRERSRLHYLKFKNGGPDAVRARGLRRYGLTVADYERMRKEQSNVCAICGQPETRTRGGRTVDLSVDHCHETGAVRGLLCGTCNTRLGIYEGWFTTHQSTIHEYLGGTPHVR